MENEFKKIYDPSRKVTYEQPSEFSQYRMVMAAQSQASSGDPEDPPVSLNIKDHFLVGEVVEGEFGKHNHDEFWSILSQKDTLDFLDQVVGKERERKAKKKAARDGAIETAVTIIAAAAATVITMGAAGPLLVAAYITAGSYVAYKAHQGYQAGGWTGLALGAGSAALAMFYPGAAVSVGGSYTKEQGFGFNVGGQLKGTPQSLGIGYTENGGFGFNAGVKIGNNVSLNMNVHESGAWGVGASLHQANAAGAARGGAVNIGYRETADGKVGLTGGFGWNTGASYNTLYTGVNYDTLLGGGVDIRYKEENRGRSFITGIDGSVGWSSRGGFQSSLELEYSGERLKNIATLNGDITNETKEALRKFDEETQGKTPLEKAELKKLQGLPLTRAEQKAYDAEHAHAEANREMGAGAMNGIAAALSALGDDVEGGWDRVTGAIGKVINSISDASSEFVSSLIREYMPNISIPGVSQLLNLLKPGGGFNAEAPSGPWIKGPINLNIFGLFKRNKSQSKGDNKNDVLTEEQRNEDKVKAIYILQDRSKARDFIKNGGFSSEEQERLTKILDIEINDWVENEKTAEGKALNKNKVRETAGKVLFGTNQGFTNPYDAPVVDSISYTGKPGVWKTLPSGKIVYDHSASVELIDGNFKKNPEQWDAAKEGFNSVHYPDGVDEDWRTDLSSRTNPTDAWYGPNAKFKVIDATVGKNNTGASNGEGSAVVIEILDGNGKAVGRVRMMHFGKINNAIFQAAGTEAIFDPGTFIGTTDKLIGANTGAHLHIESLDQKIKRDTVLRWMRGYTQ